MADLKISQLNTITTLTPATDVLPVVDVNGVTKKITTNQILGSSGTATLASATISGDLTVRTNKLAVTSAGVGFGTTTPAYPAHFRTTSPVIAIQDDTSAATGVGGTMNFLGFTSGTSGANIFAQIKGVKTAGSAGGEYQVFTSDSAGNSVQRYLIDSTGVSTWAIGGSTAMTLNANGLGIGVTPSAFSGVKALQIGTGALYSVSSGSQAGLLSNAFYDGAWKYISTSFAARYDQPNGSHQWFIAPSGTAGNAITFTQAMTLDASGNLLVGTTSQNGSWNTKLTLSNDSGTTKWAVGPYLGGVTNFLISAGAAAGVYLNGTAATSWTSASDERLKDIIEPISNAIAKVGSLRAVIGKFKFDENNTRKPFLIAQDIQAVLPEAVDASNPEKLGVAYTDVIPLLVAAIKELTARVQTLETR